MVSVAFVSDIVKKSFLLQFCCAYSSILSKCSLCATYEASRLICSLDLGLEVRSLLALDSGGIRQIVSKVCCKEIDLLIFFRDPFCRSACLLLEDELFRACDMYSVPYATNILSAEILLRGIVSERFD